MTINFPCISVSPFPYVPKGENTQKKIKKIDSNIFPGDFLGAFLPKFLDSAIKPEAKKADDDGIAKYFPGPARFTSCCVPLAVVFFWCKTTII